MEGLSIPLSAALSQVPLVPGDERRDPTLFQAGELDDRLQQVDRRRENSWTMTLDDVPLPEFLEVQLVNVTAPYLLITGLKDLMLRSPARDRYIVNVSAVEGQFAPSKQAYHPHTNMAKAALNMLTHTAAAGYAHEGIYMNAVDPGWVSQQFPLAKATAWARGGRTLPLDETDGAARLCDPIFTGILTGRTAAGHFYKDYAVAPW